MSLKSRFKIENMGIFSSFAFYAIVGIVCMAVLPISNFPPHVGIIGIMNLITAYGVIRKRTWTIWFVAMLLFVGTTFSAYMLYYLLGKDLLLNTSMIAYLILTWVFTAYIVARRKKLES